MELSAPGVDPPCPACGGALRPWRRDWLRRCEGCGLLGSDLPVRIPDAPHAEALDEAMREAGLAGLRRANNERLLDALVRLRPPPGRLLDVGSGPGFLLGQAQARGYSAEGIEPDVSVVEAARRHGAPVRQGLFPDVLGPGERFDVMVFNDVFEHIADAAGALAACAERLTPGGVLCLNCPDRRGLFFRAAAALDRLGVAGPYERLWQRGLPSPHLWYFTPEALKQAASRHGLAPAEELRLESVALGGLWRRIRYVRDEPLAISLAAYLFTLAAWPLIRLGPSDATAAFFVRPAGA